MATAALVLGILSFIGVPICGLIALILGIISLVKIGKSHGQFTGQGKAITGIIFGVWAIIRLPLIFALLLPAFASAREKARSISCVSNLRQVGLALQIYADDYRDYFPTRDSGAETALDDIIGDPRTLICPAGGECKILVNGQDRSSLKNPSCTITAYCPSDHKGRVNVICADGHVESIHKEQFNRVMRETRPGRLPVLE